LSNPCLCFFSKKDSPSTGSGPTVEVDIPKGNDRAAPARALEFPSERSRSDRVEPGKGDEKMLQRNHLRTTGASLGRARIQTFQLNYPKRVVHRH